MEGAWGRGVVLGLGGRGIAVIYNRLPYRIVFLTVFLVGARGLCFSIGGLYTFAKLVIFSVFTSVLDYF